VDVVPVRKQTGEDVVGWIAACVLVAIMLPVLGMLYLDILEAKHEVKEQTEKVEKLRRAVERQERDKKQNDTARDQR
jgi:sensor c-di-GMP phosphodiesterase-like protein